MSPDPNEALKHLRNVITTLKSQDRDPKLDAIFYFVKNKKWIDDGCIIFSQYYDTVSWIAENLSEEFMDIPVAVYAGAGKSKIYFQKG